MSEACVILHDIHVDIMDYIKPAYCNEAQVWSTKGSLSSYADVQHSLEACGQSLNGRTGLMSMLPCREFLVNLLKCFVDVRHQGIHGTTSSTWWKQPTCPASHPRGQPRAIVTSSLRTCMRVAYSVCLSLSSFSSHQSNDCRRGRVGESEHWADGDWHHYWPRSYS